MDCTTYWHVLVSYVLYLFVYKTDSACTWPSDFVSSTWTDSETGDVVFQSTTLTGFQFTVLPAANINDWECYEFGNDSSYLVMKTTNTFVLFVTNVYHAYRCLKLTKITEASYRYYQIDPIQTADVGFERLTIVDTASMSGNPDLCNTNLGASGSEYRVLLKSGSESSSRITSPYNLLADYSYTYSNSDGSVTCDPSTDVGQTAMCTNITQLTFQYPACTSFTVYSTSATVWCTDVVTVDSVVCATLYNGDQSPGTIDNTNTYLFTCICISADGTQASVTPQYCKLNQSASQIPTTNSGTSVGNVLALTRVSDFCPPCPTLSAPLFGSFAIATDGAVTSVTYACDTGYTLSGDGTRVCQSNGTWSGNEPSCTCAIPEAPTNGTVTLVGDGLTIQYSCDVGTVLNGVTTRTCQTDTNTWTETAPTCETCQHLSQPSDGAFMITSNNLTSIVTYSCNVNFSLSGDVTRTCQIDTTWNSTAPTCKACPNLSDPDSGSVTLSTDGQISVATYSCSSGYSLLGVNTSSCIEGVWDSSAPSCLCVTPTAPVNGSVQVAVDGSTATYTCDVGFTLSGQHVLTCQTGGSGWDAAFPTCAECINLTPPTNGSLALSTNDTVTSVAYMCDVGFTISGSAMSECSTSGAWSTVTPTCTLCDTLTTPSSGNLVFTTDGTTTSANYTCDVGSTLNGDATVSCDSSGTWGATSMNATCETCPSLGSTPGGAFEVTTNGTTTSAELICQSGYALSGTSSFTCLASGAWSSSEPTCVYQPSDEGDGLTLLPAVIALSVVCLLLLAAFIVALVYIFRQKKANDNNNSKPQLPAYESLPENTPDPVYILGKMLNEAVAPSIAPSGHQHHVMPNGSPSMSRAPSSHNVAWNGRRSSVSSASIASPHSSLMSGPITPRSIFSATSSINRLDLVKETTSASLMLDTDVPAPWASHKVMKVRTPRGKSPRTPRDSNPATEQSDKRTNPLIPRKTSGGNELKLDLTAITGEPASDKPARNQSARSPRKKRNNVLLNHSTLNRDNTIVTDRLPRQGRATTPVKHVLSVKTSETPRTPRSGVIANVSNS